MEKGNKYKIILLIVLIAVLIIVVAFAASNRKETEKKEESSNTQKENIVENTEEEQPVVDPEAPKGAAYFCPGVAKSTEQFDSMNLKYDDEQDLYYTDFLGLDEYNKMASSLDIETVKNISEYGKNKDVVVIFKKTTKKLRMNRIKEENGLEIELTETNEEYEDGFACMLVIMDEGKHDEYNVSIN